MRPNSIHLARVGKGKNDKIDAYKIAHLLRGGNFPLAYIYPARLRATRDLLRRRMRLMRDRAQLPAHVQNTSSQYELPEIGKKIRRPPAFSGGLNSSPALMSLSWQVASHRLQV